jgi:hypothetical protein
MPSLRINQWLDKPLPQRPRAAVATINPSASSVPVASPFIPGTSIQYAWDSTSLGWFKRCPRLYQYKMIDRWTPKVPSEHLTFGIHYHSSLQRYDIHREAGLNHPQALLEVVRQLVRDTADFDPDNTTKNRDTLLRSVIWYLDHFQGDRAMTVILANGKPAVEVSFRFELDFGPKGGPADAPTHYVLCGHLDRIVDYLGERFVMDHKTTKYSLAPRFWEGFSPDNQVSLYSIAGKVVADATIHGVIIDAAQVLVGSTSFARNHTRRTQPQLDEWLVDLQHTLDDAERCAVRQYWPQNDTSCDKYGGCEFRHVCSMQPSSRPIQLDSQHTKGDQWNPLNPR